MKLSKEEKKAAQQAKIAKNINTIKARPKSATALGLAILAFIVALVSCEPSSKVDIVDNPLYESKQALADAASKAKADKKALKDAEFDRYVNCQLVIEQSLKNPKSFDIVRGTVGHNTEDDTHYVSFDFYAKNSFNAELLHTGICLYDLNNVGIDYAYEQK